MDTLAEHHPVPCPHRLYSSYAWLLVATYQVSTLSMQLNPSFLFMWCFLMYNSSTITMHFLHLLQLLEGVHLRKELEPIVWKHFVDHIVPAIRRFQCTQKIDEGRNVFTKDQIEVFIDKALQNQPTSVVSLYTQGLHRCGKACESHEWSQQGAKMHSSSNDGKWADYVWKRRWDCICN